MPRLQLMNCLWLLIPVLVWNIIFAARLLQDGFSSDAGIPQALLIAEQCLRIVIFAWPLFLPLRWHDGLSQTGIALYAAGILVYCASWIPLLYFPEAAWSRSAAGLLAPAYTPLLWLAGIALIGSSWAYALAALLFTAVHIYHNILSFELFGAVK